MRKCGKQDYTFFRDKITTLNCIKQYKRIIKVSVGGEEGEREEHLSADAFSYRLPLNAIFLSANSPLLLVKREQGL